MIQYLSLQFDFKFKQGYVFERIGREIHLFPVM